MIYFIPFCLQQSPGSMKISMKFLYRNKPNFAYTTLKESPDKERL